MRDARKGEVVEDGLVGPEGANGSCEDGAGYVDDEDDEDDIFAI